MVIVQYFINGKEVHGMHSLASSIKDEFWSRSCKYSMLGKTVAEVKVYTFEGYATIKAALPYRTN